MTPDGRVVARAFRDTAVITGVPDVHAAALGTGATRALRDPPRAVDDVVDQLSGAEEEDRHRALDRVGTRTRRTIPTSSIDNQETGAKSLEWLRALLGGAGSRLGFDEMTGLAATSPPGAHGVLFTPWLAGERSPVDNKRASRRASPTRR